MRMEKKPDNFIYMDTIATARQFCDFIETASSDTGYKYLRNLQQQLLQLYQYGVQLPETDLKTTIENTAEIEASLLKQVLASLADRIIYTRFYAMVFDPSEETDKEVVIGDLLDDIEDIYKDVKRFLLLWDTGTEAAKENACWDLKFLFVHHWGDHCANALYAIHYFLQKDPQQ